MFQLNKRQRIAFNEGWRFTKGDIKDAELPNQDDSNWRLLDLPHDFSIEGPFSEQNPMADPGGYLPSGVGWYRKSFSLPDDIHDKKIFIDFDGIYMNSTVWLNSVHLGSHPNGYTSLQYDLTSLLKWGGEINIIAVRVDTSLQPASRWYTGSGIYRDVRLLITDNLRIERYGNFITTPKVTHETAIINIQTEIRNDSETDRSCRIKYKIFDDQKEIIQEVDLDILCPKQDLKIISQDISISSPKLWSVDEPTLYCINTEIFENSELIDDEINPFGIRKLEFDSNKGVLLNDKPIKLKGVCLHHDNGCLGSAAYYRAVERKLEIMKTMGCNAIRTSHNPPSPHLLDVCDRIGLLVMNEAFDEWQIGKCPLIGKGMEKGIRKRIYGYSLYFDDWHEKDLSTFVRRDRNHPSVLMWSIGNEIREQIDKIIDGNITSLKLKEIVKKHDPTRLVTCGCSDTNAANISGFAETLDIVGYNYKEVLYKEDHEKNPNRLIVSTETFAHSTWEKRGKYNLDTISEYHWIKNAEYAMKMNMGLDYIQGFFIWTGMDYLGEPKPFSWPYRSSKTGSVDTCGFPKDAYYFYQAYWTEKPVLHILPHWNLPGMEGKIVPVFAYTNCDAVELFLNGKSLGIKKFTFIEELHLSWEVEYQPGILEAHGFNLGQKVCEDIVISSGRPEKLVLEADRTTLNADGMDLCYVTVRIFDGNRNFVPDAEVLVNFEIEGEAVLIGVDNGDPSYVGNLKGNAIPTLSGMCLAVLRCTKKAGDIKVIARSENTGEEHILLKSVK
jgi:beta-galactosidase